MAGELDGLAVVLPPGQGGDALHMLAAGSSVEEAWAELVTGEDPGTVDQSEVDAALARPAPQSMFYVVQGGDGLLDVLSRPSTCGGPSCPRGRSASPTNNGTAAQPRSPGGAGTGTTVVAMHRAKFLADLDSGGPILFTTFIRNLATAITRDLRTLGGEHLPSRVDVRNIDRVTDGAVRDAEGRDQVRRRQTRNLARRGRRTRDTIPTELPTPRMVARHSRPMHPFA